MDVLRERCCATSPRGEDNLPVVHPKWRRGRRTVSPARRAHVPHHGASSRLVVARALLCLAAAAVLLRAGTRLFAQPEPELDDLRRLQADGAGLWAAAATTDPAAANEPMLIPRLIHQRLPAGGASQLPLANSWRRLNTGWELRLYSEQARGEGGCACLGERRWECWWVLAVNSRLACTAPAACAHFIAYSATPAHSPAASALGSLARRAMPLSSAAVLVLRVSHSTPPHPTCAPCRAAKPGCAASSQSTGRHTAGWTRRSEPSSSGARFRALHSLLRCWVLAVAAAVVAWRWWRAGRGRTLRLVQAWGVALLAPPGAGSRCCCRLGVDSRPAGCSTGGFHMRAGGKCRQSAWERGCGLGACG